MGGCPNNLFWLKLLKYGMCVMQHGRGVCHVPGIECLACDELPQVTVL